MTEMLRGAKKRNGTSVSAPVGAVVHSSSLYLVVREIFPDSIE
jgi:hypothetical protein